jgi:hypothetical protein
VSDYPSTKALSVYNALVLSRRDLTRAEVLEYINSSWSRQVDAAYIDAGAAYLLERELVAEIDGVLVAPNRDANGKPPRLVRINNHRDLAWTA